MPLTNIVTLLKIERITFYSSLLMLISLSLSAQTKDKPWQFFVGINVIDPFPTGAPGSGDLFEEILNIDHWNIATYLSFLVVKKYLGAGFSFGTRFSLNTINQYGEQMPVESNDIAGGRSVNRKVVFKLYQ